MNYGVLVIPVLYVDSPQFYSRQITHNCIYDCGEVVRAASTRRSHEARVTIARTLVTVLRRSLTQLFFTALLHEERNYRTTFNDRAVAPRRTRRGRRNNRRRFFFYRPPGTATSRKFGVLPHLSDENRELAEMPRRNVVSRVIFFSSVSLVTILNHSRAIRD